MGKQKTLKDKTVYPAWDVAIVQGRVVFKEREAFDKHLIPLEGRENLQLVIKRKVKPRSRKVENYYHDVVCGMVGAEMCITHQEAHDFLKSMFLKTEERNVLQDGRVIRYERTMSTTELGDKRYMEYVFDEIIPWAAKPTGDDGLNIDSGLGIYIPLPNEVDWDGRDDISELMHR